MTKRDRELLEKQFAYLRPAPRYGSLKLAVTVAALLVGLGVGSTVILHDPNAAEVAASKNPVPTIMAAYEPGRRAN
jgi:microcompartment protein CcmK/EutM